MNKTINPLRFWCQLSRMIFLFIYFFFLVKSHTNSIWILFTFGQQFQISFSVACSGPWNTNIFGPWCLWIHISKNRVLSKYPPPCFLCCRIEKIIFVGGASRLLFRATIPFCGHPLSQISQLLGLSDNMILFSLHSYGLFHYTYGATWFKPDFHSSLLM